MRFLKSLSIRAKVGVAFAVVVLVVLGLGVFATERLGVVNDAASEVRDKWLPSLQAIGRMGMAAQEMQTLGGRYVLATGNEELDEVKARMQSALAAYDKARREYEPLIGSGNERNLVKTLDAAWRGFLAKRDEMIEVAQSSGNDVSVTMTLWTGPVEAAFNGFRKAYDALLSANRDGGSMAAQQGIDIYHSARALIVGWLGLVLLLAGCVGWALVAGIARPMARMSRLMERLAKGELDIDVMETERRDEVGSLARSLAVFKTEALAKRDMESQKAIEMQRQHDRTEHVETAIRAFEEQVASLLGALATAAAELRATSEQMLATAEATSRQSTAVASGAEQTASNVQTVAAATEELATSIVEVSSQIAQSAKLAGRASAEAQRSNATVQSLADTAQRVGSIVELISDIAGQTNLLALNATIEAARAGDAGKGFAVVANEVKSLANQTAKATEEIAAQIAAMQQATAEAVGAIRSIGGVVEEMSGVSATVAAAAEEQSVATREITRNAQEAAKGTSEVSSNIAGVSEGTAATGSASRLLLGSAGELADKAETLKVAVGAFLGEIRAA